MLFAVSLGTDELSVKLYAESPPAGITRPLLPFLSNTLLPLRYHPHRLTNTLFFFPFESVCPALPAPVPRKGLVAALHPTRRCSPSDGLPAASGPVYQQPQVRGTAWTTRSLPFDLPAPLLLLGWSSSGGGPPLPLSRLAPGSFVPSQT